MKKYINVCNKKNYSNTKKKIIFFILISFFIITPSTYGTPSDEEESKKHLSRHDKLIYKLNNSKNKRKRLSEDASNRLQKKSKNIAPTKVNKKETPPTNHHNSYKVPEKLMSTAIPENPKKSDEQKKPKLKIKLNTCHNLQNLNYKIPKEKLIHLSRLLSPRRFFPPLQKKADNASKLDNEYTIRVKTASFSVNEKIDGRYVEHDYFDINININFNHNDNLKTYGFLPRGYYILAYPVKINFLEMKYNNIEKNDIEKNIGCVVNNWLSSPSKKEDGQTTYRESISYQISGSVGFPKFGSVVGSYSSSNEFSRIVPDTTITPKHLCNTAKWEIIYDNLSLNPHLGTNHDGNNPQNLRWVWQAKKQEAEKNLYTITENNKKFLYFKIDLFTKISRVKNSKRKSTKWLPILFKEEKDQFFWIEVPNSSKGTGEITIKPNIIKKKEKRN